MTNQSAKEQVREILKPHFTDGKGVVYSLRLDQALSQIEEIVMGVLGKKQSEDDDHYYESIDTDEDVCAQNKLLAKQLKRWDDKISEA